MKAICKNCMWMAKAKRKNKWNAPAHSSRLSRGEEGEKAASHHGSAHLHGKQICRAHSVEVRTCHCKFKCSQSTSWPGQGWSEGWVLMPGLSLGLMIVMGTKANTSWKMHVPSYVLWLVEFRCSASALSGSARRSSCRRQRRLLN